MDLRVVDIKAVGCTTLFRATGYAICAVPMNMKEQVRVDLNVFTAEVEEELAVTEKGILLSLDSCEPAAKVMEKQAMRKIVALTPCCI